MSLQTPYCLQKPAWFNPAVSLTHLLPLFPKLFMPFYTSGPLHLPFYLEHSRSSGGWFFCVSHISAQTRHRFHKAASLTTQTKSTIPPSHWPHLFVSKQLSLFAFYKINLFNNLLFSISHGKCKLHGSRNLPLLFIPVSLCITFPDT